MKITEEIKKLGERFKQFNIVDDCAYILLQLPETWSIPNDDFLKKNFKVETTDNEEGIYFFSDADNVERVFEAASYTIEMNETNEAKMKLLKTKFNELQELFIENDLETLKKLTFTFTKDKSALPKMLVKDNEIPKKEKKDDEKDAQTEDENLNTTQKNVNEHKEDTESTKNVDSKRMKTAKSLLEEE